MFRRSLRASRARRAAATTRRRWSLRRRCSVVLALIATAGMTGGALAQSGGTAAAARTASASVTLGAHGAVVRAIQRKLHVHADGAFGPRTFRAIKRFQRRHGLTADGVAGPATLRALGLSKLAARSGGRAREAASGRSASATLQRIARCESGGNPSAVSASGRYRGKYQFDRGTWSALGGTGDPAKAPEAVQDRIAAKLLAARGTAPWPTCA